MTVINSMKDLMTVFVIRLVGDITGGFLDEQFIRCGSKNHVR